jgi:hypothetical protein
MSNFILYLGHFPDSFNNIRTFPMLSSSLIFENTPYLDLPIPSSKREDIFNTEHLMTHLLLSSTLGQYEVFPFLHIQPTISHITHLLLSSTLHQDKVFPFLHIQPTISHIVSPCRTHFSNKSLHCNRPTPVSCSSIFLS